MISNNGNEDVNPYDNLARLHNEGLNYILGRLTDKGKKAHDKGDITTERIIQLVSEYMVSIQPSATRIDEAAVYELTSNVLNKLNKTPFPAILNNDEISETGKSYILRVITLKKETGLQINLERLLEIEREIQQTDIPDNDKRYPLLCIAFAKVSIRYAQDEKKISQWLRFKRRIRTTEWPWTADAKGAVGGAVTGAVKGAILGGGILVTIAVGAVSGAIGNSVQNFFFPPDNKK